MTIILYTSNSFSVWLFTIDNQSKFYFKMQHCIHNIPRTTLEYTIYSTNFCIYNLRGRRVVWTKLNLHCNYYIWKLWSQAVRLISLGDLINTNPSDIIAYGFVASEFFESFFFLIYSSSWDELKSHLIQVFTRSLLSLFRQRNVPSFEHLSEVSFIKKLCWNSTLESIF